MNAVRSQVLYSFVIWCASFHIHKVSAAQTSRVMRQIAGLRSLWMTPVDSFKKLLYLPVFSSYILE
jgi:hypothetical protein